MWHLSRCSKRCTSFVPTQNCSYQWLSQGPGQVLKVGRCSIEFNILFSFCSTAEQVQVFFKTNFSLVAETPLLRSRGNFLIKSKLITFFHLLFFLASDSHPTRYFQINSLCSFPGYPVVVLLLSFWKEYFTQKFKPL